MRTVFTPFEKRKLTAKNKALLEEWKGIHELCHTRSDISYTVIKYNRNDLPVEYEITYKIPSFVDLNRDKRLEQPAKVKLTEENANYLFYPKFADIHRLVISIPNGFPQINGKPKGFMTTQIWHPNIICHGDENILGRICFNEGNLDASVTIVDRILQVADYLRYKNYLAEDREPYPYDLEVAVWIREVAEPMGWVSKGFGLNYEKLGIDASKYEPTELPPQKSKSEIKKKEDEIIILEDDADFEFTMDIVENKLEENSSDEVFEV
jgi:hypothetical protein